MEFERLHKALSVNVKSITQTNSLDIHLPNACTPVTQRNCFGISRVIISGLIPSVPKLLQQIVFGQLIWAP